MSDLNAPTIFAVHGTREGRVRRWGLPPRPAVARQHLVTHPTQPHRGADVDMALKQVKLRLPLSLLEHIEAARGEETRDAWIRAALSDHLKLRDDKLTRLIDERIDQRVREGALRPVGATHTLDARAA